MTTDYADFNLDEFLERERRRAQALLAGSTHILLAQRTTAGVRDDAESEMAAPTLRWPSQKAQIPSPCPRENCKGFIEIDPPDGLVRWGTAHCLLCTRVVYRLVADGTRIPSADPPSDQEIGIRQPEAKACDACGLRDRHAGRAYCRSCLYTLNAGKPCVECGGPRRLDLSRCTPCYNARRRAKAGAS